MNRKALLEELATLRAWVAYTPRPESLRAIAKYMRTRHDNDHREREILDELKDHATKTR